ncbi:9853_t:CDS:10 [Scutellospora calospora]|uniref:9853_t:CDS:1 n=1 Tax=Scutellospora calospora TaxID=85575 RepID=A0ACA9JUS2_9GLOM|nr:9853_t:CDS:10 [Scutellospora calospora]
MSLMSKLKLKPTGPIYPWIQINKLDDYNPFPRYGHSSNECAINNQIFIFGGIVEGEAQNDVFVIETDKMRAYKFITSGDIPYPRSGHTHVNIGHNMIVFGGLLKYPSESPTDFIYVLNTDSKQWSKFSFSEKHSLTQRHGHSATVIGTTMYIFGGQNFKGIYLNDLIAFDLTTMESKNLSWKFICPSNNSPPSRAGHIACAYKDNIYLFGGTDGTQCYNDIWCYDTQTNSWSEISSTEFNPFPRCYHKSALVDDKIYIFGGMTNDDKELSDLTAFRINQKAWHIFQKMGPTPSPCHGHTMTAVDNKVFILGGESIHSKGIINILDTSKIKFPTGTYLNSLSEQHLQRRSSEPIISISNKQLIQTRESSNCTNEQSSNVNTKNQRPISRALITSQITNLQGSLTRPGGPKRQVKSPLEKIAGSLPEIEENQTIEENQSIEISMDNTKVIEKDKFPETFDNMSTKNANLEFDNINISKFQKGTLEKNLKPTSDKKQFPIRHSIHTTTLLKPQGARTLYQTPVYTSTLSTNFQNDTSTINIPSNIFKDSNINFFPIFPDISHPTSPNDSSNAYTRYSDDLSNENRESYMERLQEQDIMISEFKKRESWLKSQLEFAKKRGFTPDSSNNDLDNDINSEKSVDVEKMGSEKFSIIRFIIQLNQQLQQAKEVAANQSKLASKKISNIESKVEKSLNLLNDIQSIKENLLQIKKQIGESKQVVIKPEYNIEKDNISQKNVTRIEDQSEEERSPQKISECYYGQSEEASPSKEFSECYDELEISYEIAEIEDMIRLVESKAAGTQQQLKEIKQKANKIGSDYQMIHMYSQSTEKLMKIIKDQLINTNKEGLDEKIKKTINSHDNVRTSILQDYVSQQSLNQQLKFVKKEKDLVNQEYEELKKMYEPLNNENETLKKSNELLRQEILAYEKMKENLEQEIERTRSSIEQQEILNKDKDDDLAEEQWEEEKSLKESEINLYREKNNKLLTTNEELEQKLINSENKVAMLLDQMESIIEVYRSIGDVFDIHHEEELSTVNFEIQEPKTSEIKDDYFDNLVKEKYPDLPNFVLPEYRSSPTGTEYSEIMSFDENDSDAIDISKGGDQIPQIPALENYVL